MTLLVISIPPTEEPSPFFIPSFVDSLLVFILLLSFCLTTLSRKHPLPFTIKSKPLLPSREIPPLLTLLWTYYSPHSVRLRLLYCTIYLLRFTSQGFRPYVNHVPRLSGHTHVVPPTLALNPSPTHPLRDVRFVQMSLTSPFQYTPKIIVSLD